GAGTTSRTCKVRPPRHRLSDIGVTSGVIARRRHCAAAKNQDFGTSRWQLSNRSNATRSDMILATDAREVDTPFHSLLDSLKAIRYSLLARAHRCAGSHRPIPPGDRTMAPLAPRAANPPRPALPQPEPGLTAPELIARARALRDTLRAQQDDSDARGCYSPAMHEAFLAAGFYRITQPRLFGG